MWKGKESARPKGARVFTVRGSRPKIEIILLLLRLRAFFNEMIEGTSKGKHCSFPLKKQGLSSQPNSPIFPSPEKVPASAVSICDVHVWPLQGPPEALLFRRRAPMLLYFLDDFI